MTRDEAVAVVKDFFSVLGEAVSPGLNEYGFGGVALHGARVSFAFDQSAGTLAATALIYQFPRPVSKERLARIEAAGEARLSAGVTLTYDPESRYLSLQRVYSRPVPAIQFASDVEELGADSVRWDLGILDQVIDIADAA